MPLELIIVTPQGEAFSGPVERVVLPGTSGAFGVLESHEKLATSLRTGPVEILRTDGSTARLTVSDGFAEVADDRVVVLVTECEIEANGPTQPTDDG